jgi:putative lipoic acid-binding regulatory protein
MKFPPLDLIKANHVFPGIYTFKVVALHHEELPNKLATIIKNKLGRPQLPTFNHRKSTSGKHISITFDLHLEQAEEVHIIYEVLVITEGVVLVL